MKSPENFASFGLEGHYFENAKPELLDIAARGYYETNDVMRLRIPVRYQFHIALTELGKLEPLPNLAIDKRIGVEFYPKLTQDSISTTVTVYVLPEGVPASPDNHFAYNE